jgi:hypothetical protein
MKLLFSIVLFVFPFALAAQELFSVTEPASNVAAGSIGLRINNSIMDERNSTKINLHLIPEVLLGISKKWMVQTNAFLSNRSGDLSTEGGSVYAKYRFLSSDGPHTHFRMASFARVSYNNSDVHQQDINMYGHNSGFELGLVATKLIRKVALSSTASFLKATDNGNGNRFIYGEKESRALNHTWSVGKLILPREYRDYKQTNINLMLEVLSQFNTGSEKYYLDVAPAVQGIINSRSRLDIGYRKELSGTMVRTAPNGFFLRFEHNLYNML